MKRGIGETAANCLMLLSTTGYEEKAATTTTGRREFACKTCDKKFLTFQALGGHRASHKRARVSDDSSSLNRQSAIASPPKPKSHECSICGLEFPIGQALGGHMRRHRSILSGNNNTLDNIKRKKLSHDRDHDDGEVVSEEGTAAVLTTFMKKRSNSFSKRVVCLDLNLTPLENVLVKLQMGKPASTTTRTMTPVLKSFF